MALWPTSTGTVRVLHMCVTISALVINNSYCRVCQMSLLYVCLSSFELPSAVQFGVFSLICLSLFSGCPGWYSDLVDHWGEPFFCQTRGGLWKCPQGLLQKAGEHTVSRVVSPYTKQSIAYFLTFYRLCSNYLYVYMFVFLNTCLGNRIEGSYTRHV